MAIQQPFKDPARTFTPNGRPSRKPRRIVMRLSSIVSSQCDLRDIYVIEKPSGKNWKHMSLQERLDSRPPMKLDLEGPTPCSYSVRVPYSRTVGGKIAPRTKYARDALPRPNTELWTHRVNKDDKSPTPCTYTAPCAFGRCSVVKKDAPAYTMAARKPNSTMVKPGADKEPGPNSYNTTASTDATFRHFPAFTVGCRRDLKTASSTPGPAHYCPNYSYCKYKSPAYTMRNRTASH